MLAILPEQVRVGSYSTGTLKPTDVLPVMLDLLSKLDESMGVILRAEYDALDGGFIEIDKLWADIDEAINEALPRGYRWGTSEGDGADFGIWEVETGDPLVARPVYVRRTYKPESSGYGRHAVYEYKQDGTCVRTVQSGMTRGEAANFAAALNDAVARFMHDNGME